MKKFLGYFLQNTIRLSKKKMKFQSSLSRNVSANPWELVAGPRSNLWERLVTPVKYSGHYVVE